MGGIVTSPEQLDTEDYGILSGAMQNVCNLIHVLAEADTVTAKELADIEKVAPTLAQMTGELMDTIVADIAKPTGKRNADEAGLLRWIGDDWDPRRCDIHAINEALAKR